ncbi:unnamed protein product [Rotaria sp. Silwood1]|nr:unnamed protein product [Rotaria sp. Silwood1]
MNLALGRSLGERTRYCVNLSHTKMCCCCGDWMYPSENVLKIVYYSGGYNRRHFIHLFAPHIGDIYYDIPWKVSSL